MKTKNGTQANSFLGGFRFFCFCVFAGLLGASPAQASSRELIVRFRESGNLTLQAAQAARAVDGVRQSAPVSEQQGLVKLRFGSTEEADAARARLELSPSVESVAGNLLYRPALVLRSGPAREARFGAALSGLASSLPEVGLPPERVNAGADPLADRDWALSRIGMPSADEAASNEAAEVIVAVTDTGIDYNHEDLAGALWRKPANPREIGYDFAHGNDRPYDLVKFDLETCMKDPLCYLGIDQTKYLVNPGHGTHCAGHVGAVANNSLGIQGVGDARTRIMGLKFFYDEGDENAGQGDDAAAIQAIDYAIQNGAKVISASWGGRIARAEGEASELKKALLRAREAGVLVVIAAGNDGVDQDEVDNPSYPAAYDLDNLIVVAATDSQDRLADFSSFGAKSVHIGAPGVRILSTVPGGKYDDVVGRFTSDSGAQREIAWNGTSMATPIVAGAVALVWSRHPGESYQQIRARILNGARKVEGLAGKVSTGGVLDVARALKNGV